MGDIAKNDITGDELRSKASTDKFRDNWDGIFSKDKGVPIGEDTRPKDRVKQGISGHCIIENWVDGEKV